MIIKRVKLENISVFKNFELNISDGINIIIGGNGTGKTHLLKMIYYTYNNNEKEFNVLNKNLIRKYNDCKNYVSKITYEINGQEDTCYLREDGIKFSNVNKNGIIYIPVTEMLSHSKGLLALNSKYILPFEKAELDIILNAQLPELREISTLNLAILEKIENVIDGKLIYEDDTFYIEKKEGLKIEFMFEAEGLRKFALVWQLISNGVIAKDSILLWDEPEANINPELIPLLVDILLELQRNNIQILIATHSYNLAKYFEIKRTKTDKVNFISLSKKDNEVIANSKDYFGDLKDNKIIESDEILLDEIFERTLEV